MALQTYDFPAGAASGAPGGAYVPATVADELAKTLSTLAWTVLYGRAFDAANAASTAEQLLSRLNAPK